MATAAARAPVGAIPRQKFDKTNPTSWHPLGQLMPAQHGNPTRLFLDQDSYELTVANRFVLPPLMSFAVWATNTNVLTARSWPRLKLPEGVQQVTGRTFTYNVVPTTRVPKRGTVRFMSKSTEAFSLAITQKGIGSIYEGSALNTEFGPNLIALDIRAYAESVDQGMALNTAINIVNTAHRAPFIREGVTFARNLAQEMAAELPRWACIGTHTDRMTMEVEEILNVLPEADTLLIPDKARTYVLHGGMGVEVPIVLWSVDKENQFISRPSPDTLISAGVLFGGRVQVFDMPIFKLGNRGKSFQPLEAMNTIGELYFMFPEYDSSKRGKLNASIWDIYLYSEPMDTFAKIKFVDALRHSHIWEHETVTSQGGYHPMLIEYLADLQKLADERGGAQNPAVARPQWPISSDYSATASGGGANGHGANGHGRGANGGGANGGRKTSDSLYLPELFGNIDARYMSLEDIDDFVQSAVGQASYNTDGGTLLLAEAQDQHNNIENIRQKMERQTYVPDYWAEVARLNVPRSVATQRDPAGNDRIVFVGSLTSSSRAASYGVTPIIEWTPNLHGGMDVPADVARFGMPAGMFSAAGLATIAHTVDHPMREECEVAHRFLRTMGDRVAALMQTSTLFSAGEMPVNLPNNDVAQIVLTALKGPRVPLFLAAPGVLIGGTSAESVARRRTGSPAVSSFGETQEVRQYGLQPAAGGATAAAQPSLASMLVSGAPNGRFYVTYPSGFVAEVPQKTVQDSLAQRSQLTGDYILGELATVLGDEGTRVFAGQWNRLGEELAVQTRESLLGRLYAGLVQSASADATAAMTQAAQIFLHILTVLQQADPDALAALQTQLAVFVKKTSVKKGDTNLQALVVAAQGFDGRANAKLGELKGLMVSLAARPAGQPDIPTLRAFEQLGAILAQFKAENPDRDYSRKYVMLTGAGRAPAGYTAFDPNVDAPQSSAAAKRAYTDAVGNIQGAPAGFSVFPAAAGGPGASSVTGGQVSALDLGAAAYYRCPMFMSWALLVSSAQQPSSWILPGDPTKKFQAPIARPLDSGPLDEAAWRIPHYVHSQTNAQAVVRGWQESGVYHRLGLLSGAYNGAGGSGGANPASAAAFVQSGQGFLETQLGSESAAAVAAAGGDPTRVPIAPNYARFMRGPMSERVAIVSSRYAHLPVHRLIAFAFLNTPVKSLATILEMVTRGLHLPLEMWLWRLFSRHLMGSFVLHVAGLQSGANFYNGAKFTIAHDGDRDMYHTRAVITTDAHPIRPQNHRLIRNVQPRLYAGGHDERIITSIQDIRSGLSLHSRPSIIATVVPPHSHDHVLYPVSFINQVPGQIISGNPEYLVPDLERQYFPGGHYYGLKVFAEVFAADTRLATQYSYTPAPEQITFAGDSRQQNHLAFRGYHIRSDPRTGQFIREVAGNGHRAFRRFNHPGAKDYLNGSGGLLVGDAAPVAQYGLL